MVVQAKPRAILRKRGTPEADLQRDVVRFLRLVLPDTAIIHHSANEVTGGGEAARKRQAILVGMGVYPGFPDLMVIWAGRVLFLELKSPTGRLSEAQHAFADAVMGQGFTWALVRSVRDAEEALCLHGFDHLKVRGWS